MRRLVHLVRTTLAYTMYYSGALSLWQRIALRNRAIVLMYHRVLDDAERQQSGSHPGIIVETGTFAMQMQLLANRFHVLSADEFVSRLKNGQAFPPRSCLITFDDGWRDNVTNAWPILQAHKLPALVFLPVNFIGANRLFWQERLTHVLALALERVAGEPALAASLADVLEPWGLDHLVTAHHITRQKVSETIGHLKTQPPTTIDALIDNVSRTCAVSTEWPAVDGFMSWGDVARLAGEGMAFGGHGAEHRLLTLTTPDETTDEVQRSRDVLAEHLGQSALTFSYPNGSWNADVVDTVRTCGYSAAFTTEPGTVTHASAPFTVRRINVHQDMTKSAPMFMARLVGLC